MSVSKGGYGSGAEGMLVCACRAEVEGLLTMV